MRWAVVLALVFAAQIVGAQTPPMPPIPDASWGQYPMVGIIISVLVISAIWNERRDKIRHERDTAKDAAFLATIAGLSNNVGDASKAAERHHAEMVHQLAMLRGTTAVVAAAWCKDHGITPDALRAIVREELDR